MEHDGARTPTLESGKDIHEQVQLAGEFTHRRFHQKIVHIGGTK
jgi:hypothetical protein